MLALHPNCEYCDRDLPPQSDQARICSYECTFCVTCVNDVLHNVCPNCGGNFSNRPIRPQQDYRSGVSLTHQPASTERKSIRYCRTSLANFIEPLKAIAPHQR